jgi:fatty-acyl-CoA synthase
LARRLPPYARPLFLRIVKEMPVTATFKHLKNDLKRDGYDPAACDAVYFDDPKQQAFVPLDHALYRRIQAGKLRL